MGEEPSVNEEEWVDASRAYLHRSVNALCEQGITQFLDIGPGLLSGPESVHETARKHDPGACVAYVDIDPDAVARGRTLLADDAAAAIVLGDVADPHEILTNPSVRGVIEFSRPVGVLLLGALQFVADQKRAAAIVVRLAESVPAGSYFLVSHFVAGANGNQGAADSARSAPGQAVSRSAEQLSAIMAGLELIRPGIVYPLRWRPESQDYGDRDPAQDDLMAGLWRRP
jgi:hypothetical protein